MDYAIHRPQSVCCRTGRGFAPGEEFFSALVRSAGGLERLDVAGDAWQGPPDGTVAWWRSRHPVAERRGPGLAPVEVLLDAFEALEETAADEPLRYLLALQLVRRRILKLEPGDDGQPEEDGSLVFSCRRRDRVYRMRPVTVEEAADPAVAGRLTALLWSGEAA
ncbi:MAG: hypothetical protein FJ284_03760 [Planctomycetes bacterium]|nr:hypothetical protein [Planctomycetota bacterium]MBM4058905.1 hypothetical protein [Planctomycetota bacterium]